MEKVRLEIDLHEYKRLALVIRDHKSMLYKLSMHELIRRDLVRDMDIMQGILEKSEVKQEVSK
ncbi:hypothetical protein OMAG_002739 [Candidatus Omnitrophus magneticus]|jgi:hypothetical protein|uniref:Uncharacterized protein n=1 Tax=Candidatus Omnitrophus magneticus TaxID=1609969 RepID=A0A0F0CN12_9BACT|nr:hypothetical protein OMAG_002739 [Candidatus Omnitrophus magneticus]